jgi:hypothetical protein
MRFHLDPTSAPNSNNNNRSKSTSTQRVRVSSVNKPLLPTKNAYYIANISFLCFLLLAATTAVTVQSLTMDLFTFYAPSSVLLCKPCGYAVPPTTLATHIRVHYLNDARYVVVNSLLPSPLRKPADLLANYLLDQYHILNLATTTIPMPLATDSPIPELRLYRGY